MKLRDCTRRDFVRVCACVPFMVTRPEPVQAQTERAAGPRGFGVNCFDLFLGRLLNHAGVRSPGVRLHELADLGIPFVRFPVSVFWPDEWRHYTAGRNRYFDLLDEVVWAAEKHGVKLVPTLIWNVSSVSDLHGEPVSAWADDKSATALFADRFIADVVRRYRSNPAFVAWEFANELNTYADLPNGYKWWPKTDASRGTPAQRTEADLVSSLLISRVIARFARSVRALVPTAVLSGGFDAPRKNAFNLSLARGSADTADEILANQRRLNEGMDLLSVHLYPSGDRGSDVMLRDDYFRQLQLLISVSKALSKEIFVGEFGVKSVFYSVQEKASYERLLNGMLDSGVRRGALWVFDYSPMDNDWSVTKSGARSYQLDMISKINRNLS